MGLGTCRSGESHFAARGSFLLKVSLGGLANGSWDVWIRKIKFCGVGQLGVEGLAAWTGQGLFGRVSQYSRFCGMGQLVVEGLTWCVLGGWVRKIRFCGMGQLVVGGFVWCTGHWILRRVGQENRNLRRGAACC